MSPLISNLYFLTGTGLSLLWIVWIPNVFSGSPTHRVYRPYRHRIFWIPAISGIDGIRFFSPWVGVVIHHQQIKHSFHPWRGCLRMKIILSISKYNVLHCCLNNSRASTARDLRFSPIESGEKGTFFSPILYKTNSF